MRARHLIHSTYRGRVLGSTYDVLSSANSKHTSVPLVYAARCTHLAREHFSRLDPHDFCVCELLSHRALPLRFHPPTYGLEAKMLVPGVLSGRGRSWPLHGSMLSAHGAHSNWGIHHPPMARPTALTVSNVRMQWLVSWPTLTCGAFRIGLLPFCSQIAAPSYARFTLWPSCT